jgi:hypothetical protein
MGGVKYIIKNKYGGKMNKKIILGLALSLIGSTVYAGGKSTSVPEVEPIVIPEADVVNTESDAAGTSIWSDRLYNVGLTVGTLGAGINVATPINDSFQLRLNVNGAKYSRSQTEENVDYDADLKFANVGLLVDYFPFESVGFHLTGGAYYNGNKIDASGKPNASGDFEINDVTYDVSELGKLDAKLDFDKFAPYAGIGWGNDSRSEGFGFSFDLGVLVGQTHVGLTPTYGSAATAAIRQNIDDDIAAEQKKLDDDLDKLKVYPVIMFGVTYTF